MGTLLQFDVLAMVSHVLGFFDPSVFAGVLGASGDVDSESVRDGIFEWIRPIALLVIGVVALTFLFKRQMTQFLQFILLGVVVFVLMSDNAEDIISGLAETVSGFFN